MDKDKATGKSVPEFKLFVGGHWLAGQEWFEVRDKTSNDIIGTVPMCEDELYEMAVTAARDSGAALARMPAAPSGGRATVCAAHFGTRLALSAPRASRTTASTRSAAGRAARSRC